MKLLFLLLILVVISCSSKSKVDTPIEKTITLEVIVPYQLQETDAIQIDYVQYLEETDEYALELVFKKDADIKFWYDSIAYELTDVIYTVAPEYTRTSIPDSLIDEYFNLRNFKNVKLYDRENKFLGNGELQRYEFISQNIESIPVAVYKLKDKSKDASYAVAGLKIILPEIPSTEGPEARLNQLIEYKLPRGYKESYSLRNGFLEKQLYSVQGYEKDGFNTFSTLYLEENGKLSKVNENNDFWYYWDIHPVPIYKDNQPILLCNYCKAESDWFQSGVLVFENGKYVDYSLLKR